MITVNELLDKVGGFSAPSKMPCHGYSIPAARCKTGRKMRKVAGSICAICYALKGRYAFSNVQNALERRFKTIKGKRWVADMVNAINKVEQSGFFRWHDSGDLQSLSHFGNICAIARLTPHIKYWLPTREYGMVREFIEKGGVIPDNLTVRFSALMVDGPAPETLAKRLGVQVSGACASAFSCPASRQGNVCGTCRACWNKETFNVTYKTH
tara:strand:- start:329 stop:961 length:633 start_codon:yes stop_codon:yes gene_type:complete